MPGLITPRKYSRIVSRREKTKSLLKHTKKYSGAIGTLAGAGVGSHYGKTVSGAAFGFVLGGEIARYAEKKGYKLSLRTISELSGRPKLANSVMYKFRNDPYLTSIIERWAKEGKRMAKSERDQFVKVGKRLHDANVNVRAYFKENKTVINKAKKKKK